VKTEHRVRIIVCLTISVVGILLVSFYSGDYSVFVQSYGANVLFGFGMYFLLQLFKIPGIEQIPTNAAYAMVFSGAQEMAQFVKISPGVWDPMDFIGNGVGIVVGMGLDWLFRLRDKKTPQ
jgi:hypothetical protein